MGEGVGDWTSCEPRGVAGTMVMLGADVEGAAISWMMIAESGSEEGRVVSSIRTSSCSEGVVPVGTEDVRPPELGSSSSIGTSKWMGGLGGRLGRGEAPDAGPGEGSLLESGTKRSRSSMLMRPRKDSRAPLKRCTWPSMASTRCCVRRASSATNRYAPNCASSTAILLSCSCTTSAITIKTEKEKKKKTMLTVCHARPLVMRLVVVTVDLHRLCHRLARWPLLPCLLLRRLRLRLRLLHLLLLHPSRWVSLSLLALPNVHHLHLRVV